MGLAALASRSKVLAPLLDRDYALYWFGQTVSQLGNRIYATALPFLVLALGGAASELSLALTCFTVPQVILLLLGGVLVDRFPRRSVMLLTDAAHTAVLAVAVGLLLADVLRVGHMYAVSASFGLLSAFFMPASTGLLPELVPTERLMPANALRSLSNELAGIAGPLLGGVLVATGGAALALGFDAATFLLSALCLVAIGARVGRRAHREEGGSDTRPSGYWRELREGFGVVAGSQWLWVTISLASLLNVFFAGAAAVALPVLAERRLGGASAFGWVLSSTALGAILSALLLGRLGQPKRRGLAAYAGLGMCGVAFLALSMAQDTVQAGLAAALLGGSLTVFSVIWESTFQQLVPQEALGRVSAIDGFGSLAPLPVGYLLMGALVESRGPATAILVAGAATVALSLVGLSVRSIRELR
jgi:MFS family permease